LDKNITKLHEELANDRYKPLPVKRVEIPKGPGQTRPLGVPTVRDRVVQKAVQAVIEPVFENQSSFWGSPQGLNQVNAL
jgi:RNA-directed DNA polymerase